MKQTFLLIVVLASCLYSFAQYDSIKQKIVTKEAPKTLAAPNQTLKATPEEKLPDLTIVSLNVQYNNDQVVNGETRHLITISYTIKNEGTGSVLANKVAWQGYITYDTNNPQMMAAGGTQVSNSPTAVINPGATFQGSFRVTIDFDKSRHPLYTLYLDNYNDVKESNEVNNIAQKAITF
jgi:hypothetical protein